MILRPASPPTVASAEKPIVFVVDDDQAIREALRSLVTSVGLQVQTFKTAQEFLNSRRPDGPGCLVLDARLSGLSGLDLQQELARTGLRIPIVFITGYADVPMWAQASRGRGVSHEAVP